MAIAFAVIWWARETTAVQRFRLSLLVLGGVVVLIPLAIGSGLIDRFSEVDKEADPTEQGHRAGIERGVGLLAERPLGLGLGTTTGTGARFGGISSVNDNQYVIVANELGVVAGIVFVGITIRTIGALSRRRWSPAVAPLAGLVGFSAIGLFSIVYEDLALSWSLWLLVGLALSDTSLVDRRIAASHTNSVAQNTVKGTRTRPQ